MSETQSPRKTPAPGYLHWEILKGLAEYDKHHPHHAGTTPDEKIFLYSMVRMLRPERVIEIGVSEGHSTAWLALGLKHNNRAHKGHLYSVDNWSVTWGGAANSKNAAQKRLKATGLDQFVTLIGSDSTKFLSSQPDNSADLVWIDGDHSYEKAKSDILEALRISRRMVMAHDTWNRKVDMVRQACKDIGGGSFIDGDHGIWIRSHVE